MAEPVIEQIMQWIERILNGAADPAGTITIRTIRPKIIDYNESHFRHGDVIIEIAGIETESTTISGSRTESATILLNAVVKELPADTSADTVLVRFAETIRRIVQACDVSGRACGGLANSFDCPAVNYEPIQGGICAIVTCIVKYDTNINDGYLP